MRWVFFGTPELAVVALEEMKRLGTLPSLVVCNPDAPVGRKYTITPPPTKLWAEAHAVPVFQPTSLKEETERTPLTNGAWDFFVVFAYGKLIPLRLITMPKYGTINAHPSLLPKFRGASPIRSTLLHDLSAAGVSIIHMDAEMDHGPILYQQPFDLSYPILGRELDARLAPICGRLLVHVMTEYPLGNISAVAQDHTQATFCTKITKAVAQIELNPLHLPTGAEAYALYRKICAFDGWPEAYFIYNNQRVKIKHVTFDTTTDDLSIVKVTPEGKSEMTFEQYLTTLSSHPV